MRAHLFCSASSRPLTETLSPAEHELHHQWCAAGFNRFICGIQMVFQVIGAQLTRRGDWDESSSRIYEKQTITLTLWHWQSLWIIFSSYLLISYETHPRCHGYLGILEEKDEHHKQGYIISWPKQFQFYNVGSAEWFVCFNVSIGFGWLWTLFRWVYCNPFKCKDAQKNDLYLAHISLQGHCSAHYDLFLDRSIFIMSPLSLANWYSSSKMVSGRGCRNQ